MPKQSSFTSTNPKMGGIPQYEKGGVVKANPYRYANTEESGMEVYADKPGQKSRVVGGTQSKAGAGRGGQGGPTAKQLKDYERKQNAGIFTAGMEVPQDKDGASVGKKGK